MHVVKNALEWYFGIAPAEPGQGTAWSVAWRTPWPMGIPPWLLLLLMLAVIAGVVFVYHRDARNLAWRMRMLLIGLRLLSISVLLVLLSEVTLSVERTGLPSLAILVDESASMSLEDQYDDAQAKVAVTSLTSELQGEPANRFNLVRALLRREQGEFLTRLQQRHNLHLYRFSNSAIQIGGETTRGGDSVADWLAELDTLTARGDQTSPGPAVRKVLNDLRGTPPSALILFSDGITTSGEADRLTNVADLARGKGVPVFAVGIGSEEPTRDLHLYDVRADEVAFVDDPVTFTAQLKPYGYEGQTAVVTLKQTDVRSQTTTSEALASRQVRIGADGQPMRIELSFVPHEEGEFDFVIEVASLPRETNLKNNAEIRHVSVRRERIRVLLVDSVPRYEFRYVKHLLEREATIEVRTVLQDADLGYPEQDETALPHFPVKTEDLNQYDVVIFGDVDPSFLSSVVFNNLRSFVSDTGGGLILVAGERHNPSSYTGTVLEDLLPVELSEIEYPAPNTLIPDAFRPRLTPEAQRGTNIFRLADSERENQELWGSLPGFYWFVACRSLKAGSVVFAEHPTRMGNKGKLPVITMQRFGAGKVIFHATDELWRWRFRAGDVYYGRYWIQAIRYLSRSRLLGKARAAELTADRLVYQQGNAAVLRLRFLDERLVPTTEDGVELIVERRGDLQRTISLTRIPQNANVFEGRIANLVEGTYHAWVATPSFHEAPPAVDFRVEAPVRELQNRSLARAELVETAQATHGGYYTLANVDRLPDDLPTGQAVPLESGEPILLWNRWELLVLFVMLLVGEWGLRKRFRLI